MGVVGVCFGLLRFGGFVVRVVVLACGLVFIVILGCLDLVFLGWCDADCAIFGAGLGCTRMVIWWFRFCLWGVAFLGGFGVFGVLWFFWVGVVGW